MLKIKLFILFITAYKIYFNPVTTTYIKVFLTKNHSLKFNSVYTILI